MSQHVQETQFAFTFGRESNHCWRMHNKGTQFGFTQQHTRMVKLDCYEKTRLGLQAPGSYELGSLTVGVLVNTNCTHDSVGSNMTTLMTA